MSTRLEKNAYERNTLIDPVLVRFLQTTARGCNQLSLINEFVEKGWTIPIHIVEHPVKGSALRMQSNVYGDTKLSGSSYRNLRKRLISAGFRTKRSDDGSSVTLFPGLNGR